MDELQRGHGDGGDDATQRFFEHAPDMLMVVNASDHTVTRCNQALCRVLELDEPGLVGRDAFSLFDPSCHDDMRVKFEALADTKTAYCDRARLLAPSGRLMPVSTHLGTSCNEDGKISEVYVALRDQALHQDAETLQLGLRLQAAQKMESLAMLASGVAHDFNNLLVTIIGNAGLAAIELPDDSPVLPRLKDIELASSRAAELTKQLMAYSSPRHRGPEVFDLSSVVGEMSHLLEIALAQKANLQYELSDTALLIKGDITQIRQILMNLLTNAADAMGDKRGLIAIRTGSTHVSNDYLTTTLIGEGLAPGHYGYVEVADTGSGIPIEQQRQMFDPFFTTKSKGHGLGLAAVLGIVREHAGTLRVFSDPGTGTTIKVFFPMVNANGLAQAAQATQATLTTRRAPDGESQGDASRPSSGPSGHPGRRKHILVVDDEQSVCVIAERLLERAGFRVSICADGNEALAAIKRASQTVDLVLMDIGMPYLNGTDALPMIQTHAPAVRVILMSGFRPSDDSLTTDAGNYAGFLEKPFEATTLINTVTCALER